MIRVHGTGKLQVLERNMSLSSQYLEELSRRYKRQVDDMHKSLNRTLKVYIYIYFFFCCCNRHMKRERESNCLHLTSPYGPIVSQRHAATNGRAGRKLPDDGADSADGNRRTEDAGEERAPRESDSEDEGNFALQNLDDFNSL